MSTLIEWMSDLERRVQKLERRCQEVRLTPRERFINRVNTLIEIREERSRMPDDNPLRMTLDEPFTPPGCERSSSNLRSFAENARRHARPAGSTWPATGRRSARVREI